MSTDRRDQFEERLRARLREAEYETPLPDGFHERLRARLDRVRAPLPQRRPARLWLGLAAAACLVLIGLGFFRGRGASDPLVADMVNHHETCWHIPNSAGRRAHFEDWIREHGNVTLPSPLRGLKESDRRNCPVGEGARGPHLMYLDPQGRQVSLYLLPQRTGASGFHRFEAYNVLVWERGGWLCAVVAQSDESTIRSWLAPGQVARLNLREVDDGGAAVPVRERSAGPRGSVVPLRFAPGGEA